MRLWGGGKHAIASAVALVLLPAAALAQDATDQSEAPADASPAPIVRGGSIMIDPAGQVIVQPEAPRKKSQVKVERERTPVGSPLDIGSKAKR